MKTWLITGGAGFIGSHLSDALIAAGDKVRVLDDFSTGQRSNLPSGMDLIVGDVADPEAVHEAVQGIDGCFHLAAIASVTRGVADWQGTHRVNLSGTIAVFDALRASGGTVPVVYASSAAVYGDCPTMPLQESAPCRPLSAYGADKFGCELHARVASHVHAIPTIGLRFFNVYGPRQDPRSPYSGVISIFAERITRGAPVTVFGDGLQTRDFIYVGDIVAGLVGAMQRAETNARVFNLCTGRATSVLTLAATVADLSGQSLDIRHDAPRAGEIRESVGDPARGRRALSLGETTHLRDGLPHVLDWIAANR